MGFSGSLATYAFADLLQWVDHHCADGRLTLEKGSARRVIDVVGGKVVYASSNLPRERLGTFLADSKLVGRETMHEVVARNYVGEGNLTTLLLERGLITKETLAAAATELAELIVFDSFSWSEGSFEFDSDFRPRQVLPIRLSLEAQILAFRGAKQLDDTARRQARRRRRRAKEALPRRIETDDDAAFWRALAAAGESFDADEIRELQAAFRAYTAAARQRMQRGPEPFPIYRETCELLAPRLADHTATTELVVQLASLDPFLSANLLLLGNSLTTDRSFGFPTPASAIAVAGEGATGAFLSGVVAPKRPTRSSDDATELRLWRASLATAVAAGHLAELFELDRDEAYQLGLLSFIGFADLVPVSARVPLAPAPFEAAARAALQAESGRQVADRFALPGPLTDVLAASGEIELGAVPHLHLVYLARSLTRNYQIGARWRMEGASLDELRTIYQVPATLEQMVERDLDRLLEVLAIPA